MSRMFRRLCAYVVIASVVIPAEHVTLAAQQQQTATDPSPASDQGFSAAPLPSVSDAAVALAPGLVAAAEWAKLAPSAPARPLFSRQALDRYARASASSSQSSAGSSSQEAAGAVLLVGGIVSVVATFAGIFPAYNARNCTSARVYDTSDCQKLRAAGIGLGIGGVVAAFVGFVLLMSGGTTQAAGAGGTKQAAGGGTYAQAPSGGFQPPESSASDAAREAIDEIRSQNPGTIPPAQVTGRNNGGATTLDVKNTTEYTLHVFLSGPRSAVLNLPPGYSQTLTIVPGQYEIAARVDAFNVRPFYGTQPFSGGNAYGETFYIATR